MAMSGRIARRLPKHLTSHRAAHDSRRCGRRIDHLPHLSDFRSRKATDLSVLPDDGLVPGEINAKSLIVSDIALDPLDVRTEPVQHLVRLGGSKQNRRGRLEASQRESRAGKPFDQSIGLLPKTGRPHFSL
jgi:hypothetical protein